MLIVVEQLPPCGCDLSVSIIAIETGAVADVAWFTACFSTLGVVAKVASAARIAATGDGALEETGVDCDNKQGMVKLCKRQMRKAVFIRSFRGNQAIG